MAEYTRQVTVGNVKMGGGAPISVQSMTNTPTHEVRRTLAQIRALHKRGCDIVRVSVNTKAAADAIKKLKDQSSVPLVADIHFDVGLAVTAIENGIDKVRINPGNIGGEKNVKRLVDCLKTHRIPVRIGVNSGSLEKEILHKYGAPTADALVESALKHAGLLEKYGFDDIVLSLKCTDALQTIAANRLAAKRCVYPLHIGVTEAGTKMAGTVKSAVGIGTLLMEGIGDTVRVSLSGSPLPEVDMGIDILKACGLRKSGVNVISCPTCARTTIPVARFANEVAKRCASIQTPLNVAVMGCVVNGVGESHNADIGIFGSSGNYVMIEGDKITKLDEQTALDAFVNRIFALAAEKERTTP